MQRIVTGLLLSAALSFSVGAGGAIEQTQRLKQRVEGTAPPAGAQPRAKAAEPLPTQQEIEQLYTSGDNEATLKALGKVINLRGKGAEGYDRACLLEIKAETHLRMKAVAPAAGAFGEAARVALDEKDKARFTVMQNVLRKSQGGAFVPKAKNKPKIDLIDPETRKQALATYWEEESADIAKKTLVEKEELKYVAKAMAEAKPLRTIELGATGNDERTGKIMESLSGRGLDIIQRRLLEVGEMVEGIKRRAEEEVSDREREGGRGGYGRNRVQVGVQGQNQGQGGNEVKKKRGLGNMGREALKNAMSEMTRLGQATRDLSAESGKNQDRADQLFKQAGEIHNKADTALKANYDS